MDGEKGREEEKKENERKGRVRAYLVINGDVLWYAVTTIVVVRTRIE